MKYSIIIPTYNKCDELLKPCVESILKYTDLIGEFCELIIVPNGCTDNTADYLKELHERRSNITWFWQTEAVGYTNAINLGLQVAKGDYVILLNNDTELLHQEVNNWLDVLNKPFRDQEKVGVTGPMMVANDGTGLDFLIFFCVMINRKCILNIGDLDEVFSPGYGEDTDFCLRAEAAGWKVIQVPERSQLYYEDKKMTGNFPIYHAGNQTFKDYPDADLIHRNNQLLIDRWGTKEKQIVEPLTGYEISNKVVNIERAKTCDGYMADEELEWLAKQARNLPIWGLFIEVGSWHGKSSRAIADNLTPGATLYCVDHWRGSEVERDTNHQSAAWEDGDHAYLEFCENMADHILSGKVVPVRLSSKNAAKFLGNKISADAIFIDAGHTKPEVIDDITNWLPLLKADGIICGHDMFHMNNSWPDVGEAVTEIFKEQVRQAPNTSIWVVEKPLPLHVYQYPVLPEKIRGAIIDCFPFNDELDILEIRLNELYDVVDRFVIVEAKLTHGGKPKGLNFHNNLGRFQKFLNKITYIVIETEEFPALDSWSIERFQRNAIMRALSGCKDEDIIIISDCDEIPRADVVKNYRGEQGLCCVSQRLYYYKLNCQSGEAWNWLRILPYKLMKTMTPCEVRYTVNYKLGEQQIGEGGWHFSYMGDVNKVISKIQDSAHQEYNTDQIKNPERIAKIIEEGRDLYDRGIPFHFVAVDSIYPKFVLDNIETFKEKGLVHENHS